MIDVTSLSAYELSQKLHSGEISSVDLCTAYLDRVKKFEKDVQAWQFIDKKLLIEKAEEADTYRKSGKPLGPLHGMPVAIKDIIGTYDMPTECGTVFRKKMSNSQDSEIVNLLKNSGAIIMGKTVTCELAYIHPPKTKNPPGRARPRIRVEKFKLIFEDYLSVNKVLQISKCLKIQQSYKVKTNK